MWLHHLNDQHSLDGFQRDGFQRTTHPALRRLVRSLRALEDDCLSPTDPGDNGELNSSSEPNIDPLDSIESPLDVTSNSESEVYGVELCECSGVAISHTFPRSLIT